MGQWNKGEHCYETGSHTFVAEAYPETYQTSKMEGFTKIVNTWKPLTIFTKRSILDVWQGSKGAFASHLKVI